MEKIEEKNINKNNVDDNTKTLVLVLQELTDAIKILAMNIKV